MRPRTDPDLGELQRWMQALIRFPREIDAAPGAESIEERILPSDRLSARERVDLYARQYFLRLGGALEEDFPCVRQALGREAFWQAARGYLVTHGSRSFTLAHLGASFPRFLTRVEHPANAFLVELATLEWACREAFHAADAVAVRPDDLAAVPLARWASARFEAVPSFSLHAFRYPVNAYFKACKRGDAPAPPAADPSCVACYRKDGQVWRMDLGAVAHALLRGLLEGLTLSEALERAALEDDGGGPLAARLSAWFQQWMQEGFFRSVDLPS